MSNYINILSEQSNNNIKRFNSITLFHLGPSCLHSSFKLGTALSISHKLSFSKPRTAVKSKTAIRIKAEKRVLEEENFWESGWSA